MGRELRWLMAVGLLSAGTVYAQAIPYGAGAVLQRMAADAGVIFAGQVVDIARNDAVGFVDVRFHIDDAVRGCPKTGSYVLREWVGLWTARPDRYVVGQRRLMLLTARGASGLSAPLGGTDGAIPIIAAGTEPLAGAGRMAPGEDGLGPASFVVDLRWILARAVRAAVSSGGRLQAQMQAQSRPVAVGPALPFADSSNEDWAGPIAPLNAAGGGAASAPMAGLSTVMALLRTSNGASDARY